MKNEPFFSIVIPTLNEERYLPSLLEDLSNQTYKNFEVIHIDGKSDDKTVSLAIKFTKKIDIKTKIVEVRNISLQRNTGILLAKGEWIIFMDADNRICSSFIEEIKNQLAKDQSIDVFNTLVRIDENKILETLSNSWLLLHSILKKKAAYGAMIGVKTSLAKKFPFDEKQKIMEDVIFVQRLFDEGYVFKILKNPKYLLSLRRINSEGAIDLILKNTKVAFSYYIQGKDFKNNNFGYEVKGGTQYHENDE